MLSEPIKVRHGVKRHLDQEEDGAVTAAAGPTLTEKAKAAASATASSIQIDQKEEDGGEEEEEMKESDVKRRKLTEPVVECPICMNEFSMDQIRVLPCTHIICRTCGIKQIQKNEHKKSVI
jgi:hypothetical protein